MNLLSFIQSEWFMIPIGLLLFISLVVFIERLFVINKAGKEDPTFMKRIKDYIYSGKVDSAINLCRMTNNPNSRMTEKGISRLGRPTNDIHIAMKTISHIEISKLKKGFPWVVTTIVAAPMLGFLGTVIGMIQAFANAGSGMGTRLLSPDISEALMATGAGLIAGIIALLMYNYLVARINKVTNLMESRSMEFMDLLNEPVH